MPNRTVNGWGYLYRTDTGELVSEGTVFVDPLPVGLAIHKQAKQHNGESEEWNTVQMRPIRLSKETRVARIDARIAELQERRLDVDRL
jgi:hypothetical protein